MWLRVPRCVAALCPAHQLLWFLPATCNICAIYLHLILVQYTVCVLHLIASAVISCALYIVCRRGKPYLARKTLSNPPRMLTQHGPDSKGTWYSQCALVVVQVSLLNTFGRGHLGSRSPAAETVRT